MTLPARVELREVGPRDGLQGEAPVAPADRARLIEALVAAGLRRIEAVSFVSPKAVPAMAGAADVLAAVGRPPGVVRTALVPNLTGARMALDVGVDELTVTVAVSAEYNRRNVHRTIDASLLEIDQVCVLADAAGVPVDVVISCAFGSPYEGEIGADAVRALCERVRAAGAAAVTLADTTGMATPRVLEAVLAETGTDVGLHLHETRGTGLLNLYAGLQAGVVRFDTSVGGLGGSPFAAGAAGNVGTEDAVALLDDLGVTTGVDLDALLRASALAADLVGRELPSRVARHGPRTRRSP